jgi:hypothetical protein
MIGPFLDSTDGNSQETALTITQPDIRLSKNGASFAQKNAAGTLTHNEFGWYPVALDTTDTNTLGRLIVAIHESGALAAWDKFVIVPAMIYDSLIGGTDTFDVQVTGIGANVITAASMAADVADEIWDEQIGDGTLTARQSQRVFVAALGAKISGAATTTETFRNAADSQNVIVATVDSNGNRTAVTLTP